MARKRTRSLPPNIGKRNRAARKNIQITNHEKYLLVIYRLLSDAGRDAVNIALARAYATQEVASTSMKNGRFGKVIKALDCRGNSEPFYYLINAWHESERPASGEAVK